MTSKDLKLQIKKEKLSKATQLQNPNNWAVLASNRKSLAHMIMKTSKRERILVIQGTRPEVSKLTPENTRNSQVAKLSPAELRLKHIDRHTKTMNSF